MGRPWSEEDELKLERLRENGLTYREIHAKFPGRTESSVISRLKVLKIRRPADRPKILNHPLAKELTKPHASLVEIAERHGTTRMAVASVKHRLKEAGVEVYRCPRRKEE